MSSWIFRAVNVFKIEMLAKRLDYRFRGMAYKPVLILYNRLFIVWLFLLVIIFTGNAQQKDTGATMCFVSDTQQPLFIEKLLLKPDHNRTATADIFREILATRPRNFYMLGDIVGLGYSKHKWKNVRLFLEACRKAGITVYGILGNHEVMIFRKRGERNFQKYFPTSVPTGYLSVTDSVAVILLNSNFNALSADDEKKQKEWYLQQLAALDNTDSVKAIIVCCHHSPYSNSKVVHSSVKVQNNFVTGYIASKKARLFIAGHAHAFEHFNINGKDFLVIGGGGGLHQPLGNTDTTLNDLSKEYKPMFHYLTVQRAADTLKVTSYFLKPDFSGFNVGTRFNTYLR